ncbi:MAG: alpha/beta hydrolase-fold protein [Bacteroidota bacterium]
MIRLPLLYLLMATPLSAQPADFATFLADVEGAGNAERQALVEAFWDRLPRTPLIESDTTAVLLWRGEAQSVGVLGDMGAWAATLPLTRLAGTDLWYRRLHAEPEARLEYLFMVDESSEGFGAELLGLPDPRNPDRVLSGFGPFSELTMPGYAYPEVFAAVRDGTPGTADGLDVHPLPAGVLPYDRKVLVYTPPGYASEPTTRYPTVYLMDGRDYIEFAHAPAVLDDLIARGEIEPILAVFVDPPNRHAPASPNRMTEYGLNDDFVAFLADELVPFVDARYRTRTTPDARLIVGDSYGGLIATYVPFSRPDVFGLGYSQSAYYSFQDDRMIRLLDQEPVRPIRLFVDIGTYETTVGPGMLPAAETNFLAANRRLRDVLAERGYDFVYAEYPQGHTWGNWRAHLIDGLRHFFPARHR